VIEWEEMEAETREPGVNSFSSHSTGVSQSRCSYQKRDDWEGNMIVLQVNGGWRIKTLASPSV
jgi:hypothetical protein